MKNTDFNLLAKKAFENAKEKGFHEKPKTDAHWLMLVACELAEAVEADRMGRRSDKRTYNFLLQEYGEPLESIFLKCTSKTRWRMNWPMPLYGCWILPE